MQAILVVNAGSSSLKFQVFEIGPTQALTRLLKGQVDGAAIVRTVRQAIQRKQAELKLRRMAHYDGLTGLANRDQFRKRLITRLSWPPGATAASV